MSATPAAAPSRCAPDAVLVVAWAAWSITRAAALFITPDAAMQRFYALAGAVLDGSLPYAELGFEYPPAALPVFLLPRLCSWSVASFTLAFALAMVLVDVVVMRALSRLCARLGQEHSRGPVLLCWVLSSAALGTLVWLRFDLVVVALSLLALDAALADRPRRAAAWLAVGFGVKLVPALLLPLVLARVARRQGLSFAALGSPLLTFVVVAAAVFLPVLVIEGAAAFAFVESQASRPLQLESTWAAVALVWTGADVANVRFTHEAWHVLGPAAEAVRSIARFAFPVVVLSALTFAVRRAAKRDDDVSLIASAAGVFAAFAVSALVLSPQFLLWILAPASLLVVTAAGGRRIALLGALAAALSWMLYPTWYGALVAVEPVALALLAARNLLLAAIAVLALGVGLPRPPPCGFATVSPPNSGEGQTERSEVRKGAFPTLRWTRPAAQKGTLLEMALLAALLALLVVQNLYPVVDTDVWFHLRIGADVLASGAVPTVDTYSATASGRPFVAHSWASEVIFSRVHEGTSPSGLPILRVMSMFVLAVLLLATVPRRAWRAPALLPLALVGVLALSGLVEMRPYLFSLICAAALFLLLARWREGRSTWLWLALPLTTLWANLHGSVLLVPVLLALSSFAALLSARLGGKAVSRPLLPLLIAALAVFAAALNPYGFELQRHSLELSLLRGDIKHYVLEWRPLFAPEHRALAPFFQAGAVVLAGFAGLFVRWRRRPLVELTLLAALTVIAVTSWRFMPYAVCFAFPLAADGLGVLLRRGGIRRPPLATLLVLVLTLVVATIAFGVTHASTRYVPLGLGVVRPASSSGLSLLGSSGYRGAAFSEYEAGSYLVYAGAPAIKPVIDPRIDLYSPAFVAAYFGAYAEGGERLLSFLREHEVDAAILSSPHGHALAAELEQSGEFRELGVRDGSVVLLRAR